MFIYLRRTGANPTTCSDVCVPPVISQRVDDWRVRAMHAFHTWELTKKTIPKDFYTVMHNDLN